MTPDAHGIAVLVLTILALFLFTRDRIPLESSSLAILIILVVGFELVPYYRDGARALQPSDFFLGFGNEALIAICALMMVGKALETTGALQPLANVVGKAWSTRPVVALLTTLGMAVTENLWLWAAMRFFAGLSSAAGLLLGGALGMVISIIFVILLGLIPVEGNQALEFLGKPTLSWQIAAATALMLGTIGTIARRRASAICQAGRRAPVRSASKRVPTSVRCRGIRSVACGSANRS